MQRKRRSNNKQCYWISDLIWFFTVLVQTLELFSFLTILPISCKAVLMFIRLSGETVSKSIRLPTWSIPKATNVYELPGCRGRTKTASVSPELNKENPFSEKVKGKAYSSVIYIYIYVIYICVCYIYNWCKWLLKTLGNKRMVHLS